MVTNAAILVINGSIMKMSIVIFAIHALPKMDELIFIVINAKDV